MASRSDAAAVLGLMNLPRVGTRTIHRILDALAEADMPPGLLLDFEASELDARGVLSAAQAETFTSEAEREWRDGVLACLEAADVHLLPVTSEGYPAPLRDADAAPPLLMARGRVELLGERGIAFAGARHASESGLRAARELARMAAERRFTVVSGGAAGTDAAAHEAALDAGGMTVIVLAEGILSPRGQQLGHLLETGQVALASTYLPLDGWQAWRAMERNRCILGLADRVVVTEAGVSGGTIAAGHEALAMGLPTWVLDYEEPPASAAGNRMLIESGGRLLRVSRGGETAPPPELFARYGWIVTDVRQLERNDNAAPGGTPPGTAP